MNIGERIEREIRYCKCGCGKHKRVKINSPWKYFLGHFKPTLLLHVRKQISKSKLLPREERICICGCNKTFICKINSKKKFIGWHSTKKHILPERRICLCGCSKIFLCHPKSTKKYNNLNCWLKSKKHGEVVSQKLLGRVSPIKGVNRGIEFSKKMSAIRLNSVARFPSTETKMKQSLSKIKAIGNGTFTPRSHYKHKKGYFYSKKNNINLWYNSSYELLAFQILESLIVVNSYKIQFVKIPYIFNEKNHNYIVDLFVEYTDGQKQLIEVKASWQINYDKQTQCKLDAGKRFAEQNNMRFDVWTEKELLLTNGV